VAASDSRQAIIGNADIGGLGIEERKRVTIGVELAARPESILFLDEPTSGLDSQAAFEIISFLRKIAKVAGLSVLCTSAFIGLDSRA
jgi:ATP-binding cassette subfamily G (WHITE) protein 2 (SNQ2)